MSTKDQEFLYNQANKFYEQGELLKAAQIVKEIIEKYPDELRVTLLQGHINLGLGDSKLAQQCYQAVLRLSNNTQQKQQALQSLANLDNFSSSNEIDWNSEIFEEQDTGEPTLGSAFGFKSATYDLPKKPESDYLETSNTPPDILDTTTIDDQKDKDLKDLIEVKPRIFTWFNNTSFVNKQIFAAIGAGLVTFLSGFLFVNLAPKQFKTSSWLIFTSAVASFSGSLLMSQINTNQFNELNTKKRRDQLIKLLEAVEEAARGDLTVETEVTDNTLGAIADAFNFTIQNLKEIVKQVKLAAKQVSKASSASEVYARNQASDASRIAKELSITFNSVKLMTESIQRVAQSSKEAQQVAKISSITALNGAEAVERTVIAIEQIRETVSETARKVKHLAEASQEISKIVIVISQIASRTNLLALNASVQAAKAGESGRGFAIVADEVRQLADRSAKSLKEIQQIVLQIQSETGLVMTAMEEGIQEVLDVTEKSELAKKALDDIIKVSNQINSLVSSITADTVKQIESSRAVANVVKKVESTAQQSAKESQQVALALSDLVSISKDLLISVERFRTDKDQE